MIEASDSHQYEVITLNGSGKPFIIKDGIIEYDSNVCEAILNDDFQILSFDEDLQEINSGMFVGELEAPLTTIPLTVGPPVIEEENSLDNQPAIGHLEEFELTTAEDGSYLPSTVNAVMADGSHQRLTLFPQVADGNITFMVHFENNGGSVPPDNALIQTGSNVATISEKIDSLILKNENIINSDTIFKNNKTISTPLTRRSKPLNKLVPRVERTSALHYPIKKALQQSLVPSLSYLKVKEKFSHKKDKKEEESRNITFSNLLCSPTAEPKISPKESPYKLDKLLKINAKPESKVPNPGENGKCNQVFIRTAPYLFPKNKDFEKHPTGSVENPIQLIKKGGVYLSKQPLSEEQLRQISSVLKNNKITGPLYDSVHNVRINYNILGPSNASQSLLDGKDHEKSSKRKRKLNGTVKKGKNKSSIELEAEDTPVGADPTNPSVKTEAISSTEPVDDNEEPPAAKVANKIPRTRCGRVSRPPKHIVQNYKRLNFDEPGKNNVEEFYLDYQAPTEIEPEQVPLDVPKVALLETTITRRNKRNVRPEFKCPTCKKIYFGRVRMMWHLRKFPDHSNPDEYEEVYPPQQSHLVARSMRKISGGHVRKFKQLIRTATKQTLYAKYGPLLTDVFSLWDFLLLRVISVKNKGINEVEAFIKELSVLLEKMGKISEELLSPAFNEDSSDARCVELNKAEVAYALGLPLGVYRINEDRLHLLSLPVEKPEVSILSEPTKLATTFEPNLTTTKLLECSNDSIDLDCSSKDVEAEDDKCEKDPKREEVIEEWENGSKVDDSNSQFFSEFLNGLPEGTASSTVLPPATAETLNMWKGDEAIDHHHAPLPQPIWKERTSEHGAVWRRAKSVDAAEVVQPWKVADVPNVKSSDRDRLNGVWKVDASTIDNVAVEHVNTLSKRHPGLDVQKWKDKHEIPVAGIRTGSDPTAWNVNNSGDKEGKREWLRAWKEDAAVRSTASSLFTPPIRRNSVSSFATNHQQELLSMDLHELFGDDDLMPEQGKPIRPKPSSIESIINEALFTGNDPPPSHTSLPQALNIPDNLDEVANLDFLDH